MYEQLTAFLDELPTTEYGRWHYDQENDGSPEHPFQLPFVIYNPIVTKLVKAIQQFVGDHPDMELTRYGEILEQSGIKWELESMSCADVSTLDGRSVVALLVAAMRAERFCDGTLLGFCEDGSIRRWLLRLKEIDQEQSFNSQQ